MNLKLAGNMFTDNGEFLDSSTIEALINSGLSAAIFDISKGSNAIECGISKVLSAFIKLNSPVALILRTPANRLSEAVLLAAQYKFNYVWIEDKVKPQDIQRFFPEPQGLKIIVSIGDMTGLENLIPLCSGFFLENITEGAEQLRRAGKQIFAPESQSTPNFIDCIVFERPDIHTFEGLKESGIKINQANYLLSRQPYLNGNEDIIAYCTVLAAEKCSAKAIIAMTCASGPIDRITSYYPEMPVIAAANRNVYEGLLLRFCCNYGVLPTAITKTPVEPGKEVEFARFIAGLYAYKPGDIFVVTGSYHSQGLKDYIEIVTL